MTPFIKTVVQKGCPTVDIDSKFYDVAKALARTDSGTLIEIGRASVGKECRSRWSPYH